MKTVRIYQPSKTAMQSGRAKTKSWILEHEPCGTRAPDPLMGWTACDDTKSQVKLKFSTLEEAVEYATEKGLQYSIQETQKKRVKPRTYLDNFKYQDPSKKHA